MPNLIIASLLKPIDDPRASYKIGLSVGQTNKLAINIIGRSIKNYPAIPEMVFKAYPRNWSSLLLRLFGPIFFLIHCFRLKPKVLIICCWELLPPALFYLLFFRCRLMYDVQENYALNLMEFGKQPKIVKSFMAFCIRTVEKISAPFISFYFLAEECYRKQLKLEGKKHIILENKSLRINRKSKDSGLLLCFTGTISESTGIIESLELAKKLYAINPDVRFKIVGQVHKNSLLEFLKEEAAMNHWIKLKVDKKPVSYARIIKILAKANAGFVAYRNNQATAEKRPSKMFEYMANGIPVILLSQNQLWANWMHQFQAGIAISDTTNGEEIIRFIAGFKPLAESKRQSLIWNGEDIRQIIENASA